MNWVAAPLTLASGSTMIILSHISPLFVPPVPMRVLHALRVPEYVPNQSPVRIDSNPGLQKRKECVTWTNSCFKYHLLPTPTKQPLSKKSLKSSYLAARMVVSGAAVLINSCGSMPEGRSLRSPGLAI
ncbi:hypothetical protein BJX66DRAFT_138591 [Aspergillus keveii]|uniref:Secreted protein n=1 Tax=Aspergillus keveii TaxID=714993 RepID=A0ABR4FIU3_9EURO